jgi:hypothetical protein
MACWGRRSGPAMLLLAGPECPVEPAMAVLLHYEPESGWNPTEVTRSSLYFSSLELCVPCHIVMLVHAKEFWRPDFDLRFTPTITRFDLTISHPGEHDDRCRTWWRTMTAHLDKRRARIGGRAEQEPVQGVVCDFTPRTSSSAHHHLELMSSQARDHMNRKAVIP